VSRADGLWKSDGTVAGTVLSDDINPGPLPSDPALPAER
jgi:ELWxxDGT repeat protein